MYYFELKRIGKDIHKLLGLQWDVVEIGGKDHHNLWIYMNGPENINEIKSYLNENRIKAYTWIEQEENIFVVEMIQ